MTYHSLVLLLLPALLATVARADSFLRLCAQDPASSDGIPDCVQRASRQELRELTDEERTWVVDAFRKERAVAPRQKWESILDPPGVYQLIQRLDTRLASRHLSLPYWDTSLELRLNQPGDSHLFHPSFLLRTRRRRDRRPVARPKTRFERRIRNPRDDKTARRLQSQRMRKLLKAIRRDKQSELLFLLFEMGDLFTRISTPIACPSPSPHISCSNGSQPLPKLSPSARCSLSMPEDICYQSHCIADLCTVVIETPIPTARRTTVAPPPPTVTLLFSAATVDVGNETETDVISNSTHVDLSQLDGLSTLSDDVTALLLTSKEATPPTVPPTTTTVSSLKVRNRNKQNGWYKFRPQRKESSSTTTTQAPKKREKVPRQAPINSDEEPLIYAADRKRGHQSVGEEKERRSQHDQMTTLSLSPALPRVFIPITVIEGPWRGPHRIKPAHGATAATTGLNAPIGYTSVDQGLHVKHSPGLFILQVPNPDLAGPIVEFNIAVNDKSGNKCDQFCFHQKSNTYKPCAKESVRISQYSGFSDPVKWEKTENEAISSEWIGTGYYKRRRLTHNLFSCSNNY